jgi:hypothetical protein
MAMPTLSFGMQARMLKYLWILCMNTCSCPIFIKVVRSVVQVHAGTGLN